MKTLYYFFLISIFAFSANAQTADDIIGEWQYYTLKVDPGTKAGAQEAATAVMSTMVFKFNSDKTYTFSLMGMTENGKWDVKDKTLEFESNEGSAYDFPILDVEKNLLTLDKDKFSVTLSRVGANVPPPPVVKPEKTYATATAPQLVKKWYLKQRPAPANLTEAQMEAIAETLSGSYIEFKANGKCTLQLGDKKETGQWNINNKANGITVTLKNLPKELYFTKVTTTDLIVNEVDNDDEWIFSTIE